MRVFVKLSGEEEVPALGGSGMGSFFGTTIRCFVGMLFT